MTAPTVLIWSQRCPTCACYSAGMRSRSVPYLLITLAILLVRPNGPAVGQSSSADSIFRITPQRPVGELQKEALAAQPPKETGDFRRPDLVELITLDPTIKLDIRYATADNFLSTPMYSQARAFLQRPAAEALVRVNAALRARGYGLLIHDGYRPWYVTEMFWEATPNDKKVFVADPKNGSRHNRGTAVDLTLYDLKTGGAVKMPSGYDEMSEARLCRVSGRQPRRTRTSRHPAHGDGEGRFHRLSAGVVAFRLQGLQVLRDLECAVRGHGEKEVKGNSRKSHKKRCRREPQPALALTS
jgi:D-alanyl-D-alanine dipeptidase